MTTKTQEKFKKDQAKAQKKIKKLRKQGMSYKAAQKKAWADMAAKKAKKAKKSKK